MAVLNKISQFVRTITTSTTLYYCSAKTVKLPIEVYGTEGKYASALYSAATKIDQLEAVEQNLFCFQYVLKQNPQLMEVLSSPVLDRPKMIEALKSAGQEIEWVPATSNFIEVVTQNGRLNKLHEIIDAFSQIMIAHRHEVHCSVTTAKPLTTDELEKVEETLNLFLKPQQVLQLKTHVDPSIIGGMLVSMGDLYIDLSIATKVKKYTELISLDA